MHTKIENYYRENITMGSETDEIIKELLKSLLQRYQEGLEESVTESQFIFDSDNLLEYKFNKTSLKKRQIICRSFQMAKREKKKINPKINVINAFNML